MHMPVKVIGMETDLDMQRGENIEFSEKCRILANKVNRMIKKPHVYFHDSAIYVKYILLKCCELQNCYEIESKSQISELFLNIKIQTHLVYLLSMLVPSYTCKSYSLEFIRSQIENILKGAALKNDLGLMKICHEALESQSSIQYEVFERCLRVLKVQVSINTKIDRKTAEVTFPIGEKVVNECEVLNVQGHGGSNMHCVIELPDGSVETSKASNHSSHLNSYIRIHRPNNPMSVQICFAVLFNLTDIVQGPGLHNETIKLQNFIPVSPYTTLLLKPSTV